MNRFIIRKTFGIFILLAIVFFPCFVIAIQSSLVDVGPENEHSFFVVNDMGLQNINNPGSIGGGDVKGLTLIKEPLNFDESSAELSGGFVEVLASDQSNAGFISNKSAKNSASKTSKNSGNSTNNGDRFSSHDTVSLKRAIGYIFVLIFLTGISWFMGIWFSFWLFERI